MSGLRILLVFTGLLIFSSPVLLSQTTESNADNLEQRLRHEQEQSGNRFAQELQAREESRAYLTAGQASWSAFACAHLAVTRDDSEYDRLVKFGYERGEELVAGLREEKVRREDLLELPMVVTFDVLISPITTTDFILGRMFQAAKAVIDIVKYDPATEGAQEAAYAREFSNRNCRLIGQ